MPDVAARQGGGLDWFGVEWEREIRWPDLEALDWESDSRRLRPALCPDRLTLCVILNGLLERLISLVGFEDAMVALLIEKKAVHAFFSRLTDWYVDLFKILRASYGTDVVLFHDDWGSQRATLFSAEVLRETILPCILKLSTAAKGMGIHFGLHSCGKLDDFVPFMSEAGIEMWEGQQVVNDKAAQRAATPDAPIFLDKIELDPGQDDKSLRAAIEAYLGTVGTRGNCVTGIKMPFDEGSIRLPELIHDLSRRAYA